jgi:uncharacterized protein involved in outer membrane biogenesis
MEDRLARLFVIVGGLIVLVLTAALVVPFFIDWTSYRAEFEREASRILGRQVTVQGSASARLLPFPSVTFSDVTVAGATPDEPSMSIETFSMDAELAPFLRGDILIFDMRIVRPRATVVIAESGTIDWAVPRVELAHPEHVTLERVTISDGEVMVRHEASGRRHMLSDIDGTISARTLAGPWRMEGTLALDGLPLEVSASTGTVGADGRMRLRLRARPYGLPLSVEADGDAEVREGRLAYDGQFRLEMNEGNAQAAETRPGPADYRLNGEFGLDHEALQIKSFTFETGPPDNPYRAEGEAELDFGPDPGFRIVADGAQFRFDEALAADEKTARAGGLALAERIAALRRFLDRIPVPAIPGSVEVNLPAVIVGDTTIREIRLTARPEDRGWAIRSLSAALPGRATLEANGLLRTGEDFGFSGSLLLAVGQPSGFAAWLARDVDEAIRRLPAAGFLAAVDLRPDRQIFRNMELVLGSSRFRGRLDRMAGEGARSRLSLELDGGALDIESLAAFASLFVSDTGETRLVDHDVNLKVKAGPVMAGGLAVDSLDTSLRLRNGTVEIDRLLIGGFEGASVSATGSLAGIGARMEGTIDAAIVAPDLGPAIDALAGRFPRQPLLAALKQRSNAYAGLFSDAEIDIAIKLDEQDRRERITIQAVGQAGGADLALSLAGTGLRDEPAIAPLAIDFNISHPEDAGAILALYGAPALPLDQAGPARSGLTAIGTLSRGLETRFSLEGEGRFARFEGRIALAENGPSARGQAMIEAEDIEPWLMTLGFALPGMGLGLPLELAGEMDFAENLLVLTDLTGQVAGVELSGDLNVRQIEGRPQLSGDLRVETLDLALPATLVLGEAVLDAVDGETMDAVFWPKASSPFDARLDVSAGQVTLGRQLTMTDSHMSLRLDAAGFGLSDLSGSLHGGRLAGLMELRNNDGTALLTAQLQLEDALLASLLPGSRLKGRVDLSAELAADGKSTDALLASLSGSGTAALQDLVIPGVNPGALGPVLAEADRVGRDINIETTAQFAPAILTRGEWHAGDGEVAFTIAGGVLRAPPLHLEKDGLTLTAEIGANFVEGTVRATGEVTYNPGKEALVGSAPAYRFNVEGRPSEIVGTIDTAPLAQFLTQRALEKEQARVEALQAALLERQRLRRETAYHAALQAEREAVRLEKERLEREEMRLEEDARRRAEEAARATEGGNRPAADEIIREPLPPPQTEAPADQSHLPSDPTAIFRVFGSERTIDDILREPPRQ